MTVGELVDKYNLGTDTEPKLVRFLELKHKRINDSISVLELFEYDELIKWILTGQGVIQSEELESDIKVANEFCFINLIHDMGYREDVMWTDDEDDKLKVLMETSDKHSRDIMFIVSKYYNQSL